MVEQWNSDCGTELVDQWSVVEQCNSEGGTVVEEWNSDGESVWLNSGTVMVEQCGETVDQ